MAILKINPNRMELLKLRKRRDVAQRGHKLLKDKLDELMKQFLEQVRKNQKLRKEIEEKLAKAYQIFAVARSESSAKVIEEALFCPRMVTSVRISEKRLMGVRVPEFEIEQEGVFDCYGLLTTPAVLDRALFLLNGTTPLLIKLSEAEKAVELLAIEIEKTRRRVNALEHVLIPQLNETVKYINMKLDEAERENRTRLMKIKEMVSGGSV
ncbi:V-type ATP synthase subunit D [Candidatus Oleimmundimicrobium sp.]|uniref:V-type ATP synthase subunit D n=1 Tax=Candidatus Oleimmundimicrobium sp. TaxID=3060597 RepID=UPI0027245170|nr:V-type ATP synthase subunit D [Candidatus Oleimmundimicrobium sp.]MDO8886281.1 V-type ATP synthase subunit D [Candidatus Oleimmundimicrobium sp.]